MNLLIHTINRKSLTEGRTSGLLFGFANVKSFEKGVTTYSLVTGLSACKDYLNDVLATDKSKFKEGLAYGFKYVSKTFDYEKGVLIVKPGHTAVFQSQEDVESKLHILKGNNNYQKVLASDYVNNLENTLAVLNMFGKHYGFGKVTANVVSEYITNSYTPFKEPFIAFKFTKDWYTNQILISFIGLIIRVMLVQKDFNKELLKLDFVTFYNEHFVTFKGLDEWYLPKIYNFLSDENLGKIFKSNLTTLTKFLNCKKVDSYVHSFGIQGLLSKLNGDDAKLRILLPELAVEEISTTKETSVVEEVPVESVSETLNAVEYADIEQVVAPSEESIKQTEQ